jgi:hypothetical protein
VVAEMNRRRGFSLIEVATVIATAAAIMGVAVGLLYMLLRLEEGSRDYVRERTAMRELSDQFRCDVHAADEVTPVKAPAGEGAGPAWRFSLPAGRVVEYRVEQDELARSERQEDKVLRRESYRLPAEATVSIEVLGDAAPGVVRLEVRSAEAQSNVAAWRGFRVDAVLAKDRRFARQTEP